MTETAEHSAYRRCCEPGLSPEVVAKYYSDWAPKYNQELFQGSYNASDIAVAEVASRFPEDRRRTVKVMDVAAGTGRVGVLLRDKGFMNIDALEPSEGMMNLLKETGVYITTYEEFLGIGENSVPDGIYDVSVIAGGMGEGHIPCKGIDDMIRITKPGGYAIIVMRKEYLQTVTEYKDRLLPLMDSHEKNGKWEKVEVKTVPNYYLEKDGLVFTYRVL